MSDSHQMIAIMAEDSVRQGCFRLLAAAPHFYKANAQLVTDVETLITWIDSGKMTPDGMAFVLRKMQDHALDLQRIAIFGPESVVNEHIAQSKTGKRK